MSSAYDFVNVREAFDILKLSKRKKILFACACVKHRMLDVLQPSDVVREIIKNTESYADGKPKKSVQVPFSMMYHWKRIANELQQINETLAVWIAADCLDLAINYHEERTWQFKTLEHMVKK